LNAIALVVLAALLLNWLLGVLADALNLRALEPEVPPEMARHYDAETYRRSQEYTRARTRFGLITASFDLVLLLGFWWLGGFEWLDGLVRTLGYGEVVSGLFYVGALVLGSQLIGLPFDVWSTFVIEERFGFNRTTPRTFVLDRLKGLLLMALIGGPLLAAIFAFFANAGPLAWLWCWLVVTAVTLVIQFVGPTWIMPLFNKFQPLEEGELSSAILAFARKVGFPLGGVYVIDGSRRSSKANAFFTGFGSTKRIALYDTLIEKQSTPELVAVLAHEVGHYKRGHILKGVLIQIAHLGLLFWLISLFLDSAPLFEAFGVSQPSVYVGLVLFALLYTPIELVLSLVMHAFSRKHEYEADEYAVRNTGTGEALVEALKKLSVENLSNLSPHPFYVALHHSHPPLLARIRAIRAVGG
jgi:STE24 endopeptidase